MVFNGFLSLSSLVHRRKRVFHCRHCHEELLEVQRSKDEAIEDLEREKTTLRQKWQKAMEESRKSFEGKESNGI